MSAHMPGPWEAVGFYVRTPMTASGGGWMVADCQNVTWPREQVRANARLIAAAPDLLAVAICQDALDGHPDLGWPILESYGWDRANRFDLPATEFVRRLRHAAIRKATGAEA